MGVALSAALTAVLAPRPARAFDAEVRAETLAQSYQLRGPSGASLLSFRRLTQTLSLGAVDRPSDPRGVTVLVRARLRIDSDFGGSCDPVTDRCLDELNRGRAAEFAPLFARRAIDLSFAWLELSGLLRHHLDVRVGRQLVVDPLGFFLFDGARATVRLGSALSLEAYGGLEARSGFPLSNGRYERDGLTRIDRAGWDPGLAPYLHPRSLAGVFGAAVETLSLEPWFTRVTYRRVWSDEGVAEEKLGGSTELALTRRLRAYSEAVYSLPQRTLANLVVGGEWTHARGGRFGVELSRYRPTFDLTSIWASFWTDPTDDLTLRGELPLRPGITLTASLLGRRYALGEGGASAGNVPLPDLYHGGAGAALVVRRSRYEGSLRTRFEAGALGLRAGADLTARVWVLRDVVRLDAGLSAWSVEDTLRPDRAVASVGVWAGGALRLGRVAVVHASLEDDVNRLVGHRLRAVAVLDLRSPF